MCEIAKINRWWSWDVLPSHCSVSLPTCSPSPFTMCLLLFFLYLFFSRFLFSLFYLLPMSLLFLVYLPWHTHAYHPNHSHTLWKADTVLLLIYLFKPLWWLGFRSSRPDLWGDLLCLSFWKKDQESPDKNPVLEAEKVSTSSQRIKRLSKMSQENKY